MDQISLFDYAITLEPKQEASLRVRDVVYRVVLDVIEKGTIDHLWDVEYRDDRPELKFGYSARRESTSCFMTFWNPDIGNTVFTDKETAKRFADDQRCKYAVIRKEDMMPEEVIGYRQIYADGKYQEHYLVILRGNMIYEKTAHCYPFLTKYKSEEELRRDLAKLKKKYVSDSYSKFEREEITPVFEDMYLSRDYGGKWSTYDYTAHHAPVTVVAVTR